jgi:hypothetical protein
MWQLYVKVPAVVKVRVIDVFELIPVISAGVPIAASKKTLCPTEPNANVTSCPTLVVSVAGMKLREGVALILSATAGGLGLVGEAEPELPPPQALAARQIRANRESLRTVMKLLLVDVATCAVDMEARCAETSHVD